MPPCPACNGSCYSLGQLGHLAYFKCRNCGTVFYKITEYEHPSEDNNEEENHE